MTLSPPASQPEVILAVWIPISIAVGLLAAGALCWLMLRPDEDAEESPASPPSPAAPFPPMPEPTPRDATAEDPQPGPAEWPTADKFAERVQVSWPEETGPGPGSTAASPELQAKKELPDLYKQGVEIVEAMPFYAQDPGGYIDKYGMRAAERKFAWEKRIGELLDAESLQKYRISFQARMPPDPRASQRFVSPDEELQRDVEIRLTRLAHTLSELYGIKVRPPKVAK